MDEAMRTHRKPDVRSQTGATLIETMIACAILLVVVVGLLSMITVATNHTENQGHLVSRTTQYAQDKMEQLLALEHDDAQSDTTVYPVAAAGGTGLAVGGSADPAAPVALYVDYLDGSGNLLASAGITPPEDWFYKRVWQVSDTHTPPVNNLKQITVTAIVRSSVGGALLSRSTVAALQTRFPL
jgi:Tfp pilus assembly protein PilV